VGEEEEMSKSIESLREQRAEIQAAIDRIEAVDRFKESTKLIGKCFRYRNCYSCPKTDQDYWWLYTRVTACAKDGWLVTFNFQVDQHGDIWIEPQKRRYANSLGEPISLKQFQHAWRVVARMINDRAQAAKAVSP
jgi:hypothetical protein